MNVYIWYLDQPYSGGMAIAHHRTVEEAKQMMIEQAWFRRGEVIPDPDEIIVSDKIEVRSAHYLK